MSTDSSEAPGQPESAERLDVTTDELAGLRAFLADEQSLQPALDRLAEGAVRVIPDAVAVTIIVLTDADTDTGDSADAQTVAWTDETYVAIDAVQHQTGRGPCLEAARTREPVRASTREHRDKWPEFAAAAEHVDVEVYLSVPLLMEPAEREGRTTESELVGAFNIYGSEPTAFEAFDQALMQLFALAATAIIGNERRWRRYRDQARNLEVALDSRSVIEQAKGVLMAAHQCSEQEAFRMLTRQSQHRNVKLRQIAEELMAKVTRGRR